MKKKFKIGIIGLGVGVRHLEAYIKYGCKIKKIYDLKKNKMRLIKKKYPNIVCCNSENDIFKDKDIDIVSIYISFVILFSQNRQFLKI